MSLTSGNHTSRKTPTTTRSSAARPASPARRLREESLRLLVALHGGVPRLEPFTEPIVCEGVWKVYGSGEERVEALRGVDLRVARGEMVALVGASGSGKSTLLNVIGCVDVPTRGEVTVAGERTSQLDDERLTALRRVHVGTVFQFFNFLPTMTLEENVELPLVLAGEPGHRRMRRVGELLERVGVAAQGRKYPSQVSGGQLQRAAVARAVAHRPAVVLADEPTGNLDSVSGAAVLALLREIADEGQTILMVTHSQEAARVADRVVQMRDGRIVA
ncbi:ABC transporter ATP-binding protein [bacterium]|nr:MAG: ABC transporter ATP-binding protein [bacterium]